MVKDCLLQKALKYKCATQQKLSNAMQPAHKNTGLNVVQLF